MSMKQQPKFSQQQQQKHHEQQAADQINRQQAETAREFASAEEVLRFDAASTTVPPEIAQRLKASAANLAPGQTKSWWRNLFGG